jgi:DNA-directed RNA polymerase specialized sigma24 family protein
LVARAGRGADAAHREALGELLKQYLPALHFHLVTAKGLTTDRADDVLRDFVAGKVLERELISSANRDLGKFRTFLLTPLNRFFFNQVRDAAALKRAASQGAQALGERAEQLIDQDAEQKSFETAWARNVLTTAEVRRLLEQCEAQLTAPDDHANLFTPGLVILGTVGAASRRVAAVDAVSKIVQVRLENPVRE